MATSTSSRKPGSAKRSLPVSLLIATLAGVALWLTFFDSHSILQRVRWHHEYVQLSEENEALQGEVEALEEALSQPVTDEVIERIAREEYGMRRPGETVYRVEEE